MKNTQQAEFGGETARHAVVVSAGVAEGHNPKRAAIVRAATELFLDAGYAATSMDAIAACAEVSKRTVYSRFDSKESLFAAVMNDLCERLVGPCPLGDDWHGPPEEVMPQIGHWVMTLSTAPEAIAVYRVVVGEAVRTPGLGRIFMDNGPGLLVTKLTAYIEAERRSGRLDVGDVRLAAAQFMELVNGPLTLPLLLNQRPLPSRETRRRVVDGAVTVFLDAYRPDGRHARFGPRRR